MAKVSFMFPISSEQKEDIEKAAAEAGWSTASLIRAALAAYTGYDLSDEPNTRQTKYASKAERIQHQRAVNKAQAKRNREVLRLVQTGNSAEAAALAAKPLELEAYNPGLTTTTRPIPSRANPASSVVEAEEDETEEE